MPKRDLLKQEKETDREAWGDADTEEGKVWMTMTKGHGAHGNAQGLLIRLSQD